MSDIPERLSAALSGRYVVEREVGAGGMATVYLARDLRHKRPVAVKVVRPELGGPDGIERFLREIELAARLQHPHILPVFDSGVVDDANGAPIPYLVMPYVEGETLRQLLQREGRLPVDAAMTIAIEVADALAYAHGKEIVHRDIKPENILLSGGHAVVADFGVARALEQGTSPGATDIRLTRAGLALGTPQYMSPEQATGDAGVDARADQYSLACVIYEMLAGEPPFTGPTAQTVIAKSLTSPRPHIGRVRAGVPPDLDGVVLRALALEPRDRYPDMAALRSSLTAARRLPAPGGRRRVIGGAVAALAGLLAVGWFTTRPPNRSVAPAAQTLAVLPFHTSGPGVEFLREGMVDLLATNLRGVADINTVDPRNVLRTWGNGSRAADDLMRALDVGRDLGAGSVVLGSVVSTGGRVRLAADIYSVGGDRLARAQVDGAADSVLGAVDRLSLALLRDIWRSKEPLPNLRLASLTSDSIGALREYLQGEGYYRRVAWDSAQSSYTRAVEIDSTFALAHLRRAQVFGWTGGYGDEESRTALAAANRFAVRLPARDRRLLAGYQLFDKGKPASADSLRAYVAAYPEDVDGWFMLGEAVFHTNIWRPLSPESTYAAFDSVLRRDSTLFPALLHPVEVAAVTRDSARFARYFATIERTAPSLTTGSLRTTAQMIWGPEPGDSALIAALREQPSWIIMAVNASFQRERATGDSIAQRYARVQRVGPKAPRFQARGYAARTQMLAGLGRWAEMLTLADSLRRLDPEKETQVLGYALALGLAPPSRRFMLDSIIEALPPGPEAEYARALTQLVRGDASAGRHRIARVLAQPDSATIPDDIHGYLMAADGWGALLQGDTASGLRRLRAGLDRAAAPGQAEDSGFLRFQLALALAARPETREEGITSLRYGFDFQPLFIPLATLALGRTYEAAGKPDSAALAYRRFIRFWNRADPELQSRVTDARRALEELTQERPGAR
jgi:eukaryotic-like serine/threonine-protein kinase